MNLTAYSAILLEVNSKASAAGSADNSSFAAAVISVLIFFIPTNQIAKSLKTNRTYTIGLIVADISNPYFSGLARIIEDEADKRNYTVIIGSSDENPGKFEKLIETFTGRKVDGLLIAATAGTEDQLRQLQEQKVPFVLVDRYFPGISSNYVGLDNYNASYKAVQHLAEKGRKRIGLITYDTQLFHINERKRVIRVLHHC